MATNYEHLTQPDIASGAPDGGSEKPSLVGKGRALPIRVAAFGVR